MYYNHNTTTTAKGIRKNFGKILEIIALRNENLLHVNLKLKLFKKYHTINSFHSRYTCHRIKSLYLSFMNIYFLNKFTTQLRNENLLHVNLKLKLFKKYHTINSLNVSKIIQHNARKNNSA
jgi:hypothetical protein